MIAPQFSSPAKALCSIVGLHVRNSKQHVKGGATVPSIDTSHLG